MNFMVDSRHHVGNDRGVCRGSFGWRDDHHFGWQLHTLVAQYISNPSAYERMPRQVAYEAPKNPELWGALEPYHEDAPEIGNVSWTEGWVQCNVALNISMSYPAKVETGTVLVESGQGDREIRMRRYTKPEKVHHLLLDQLGFTLPAQPPPEIQKPVACGGDLLTKIT